MLTADSVVVAGPDQLSTELAGEAVILGLADGTYYGLDGVGARIWALLQQPRRLGEVADTLVAEFDVDRDRVLADLLALCGDLRDRGLIIDARPA